MLKNAIQNKTHITEHTTVIMYTEKNVVILVKNGYFFFELYYLKKKERFSKTYDSFKFLTIGSGCKLLKKYKKLFSVFIHINIFCLIFFSCMG